jgi:UDPglucose--hexose-1-phosphate uridylyltransferase
MESIYADVETLVSYAVKNNLIAARDRVWATNLILSRLRLDYFKPQKIRLSLPPYPDKILAAISAWAAANGRVENLSFKREMLETDLMGILTLRPSDFVKKCEEIKKTKGLDNAIRWMYKNQEKTAYIKTERIAKNISWTALSRYGRLDITINLSKPEKTPKEIAALKKLGANALQNNNYPKCLLCIENEGYGGRFNHPARQNLRLLPLKLGAENWYFQYSPYVYYNEHCIVLKEKHSNMEINGKTFERLAAFLEQFPSYFIGSNADLPIVGGSILNHDHYQGGRYVFPMHKAEIRKNFKLKQWPKLGCAVLDWPVSVIRFTGGKKDVIAASKHLFSKWINYCDASVNLRARSGAVRHNTLTPIAKMSGKKFQFDLALRNNAVSKEFPEGIFHSGPQYHHIKRENIGLIVVMGLAVLPGRLKSEFEELSRSLVVGDLDSIKNSPSAAKHYDWARELSKKYKFTEGNVRQIIRKETVVVFSKLLECWNNASYFLDDWIA